MKWLWWSWDDAYINENENRKWWCAHLAFIHSFTYFESSIIVVYFDEIDEWIWLSINIYDCGLVFFLCDFHTWLTVFDYKFNDDHFIFIWFAYSYGIGSSWPMVSTSLCCCTDATYALIFCECRVHFGIWDKTSPLVRYTRFNLKGEHHDWAIFESSIHYPHPFCRGLRHPYLFLVLAFIYL